MKLSIAANRMLSLFPALFKLVWRETELRLEQDLARQRRLPVSGKNCLYAGSTMPRGAPTSHDLCIKRQAHGTGCPGFLGAGRRMIEHVIFYVDKFECCDLL